MSDFKVGDVVRVKADGAVGEITSTGPIASGVRFNGRVEAFCYYNSSLSLVSRPSEAKRNCDLSCAHLYFGTPESHAQWHRDNDKPPAPALKVGDRVRVKPGHDRWSGVTGTITILRPHPMAHRIRNDAPYAHILDAGGEMGECQFRESSLELLPPEPAQAISQCAKPTWPWSYPCALAPTHSGKCLDGAHAQEAPMTATEASIRADEPARRAQQQEQYLAAELSRLTKERLGIEPPSHGWMPAGTYMPLKQPDQRGETWRACRQRTNQLKPGHSEHTFGEQGAGIATAVPAYSRRFPSRTTQWSNAGDDYELLEDAK